MVKRNYKLSFMLILIAYIYFNFFYFISIINIFPNSRGLFRPFSLLIASAAWAAFSRCGSHLQELSTLFSRLNTEQQTNIFSMFSFLTLSIKAVVISCWKNKVPLFVCLFVFRCESISITVLSLTFLES